MEKSYKRHDNDDLYELPEIRDVLNLVKDPETGKDKWRGWYMRKFYEVGREDVLKLAAIARADGGDIKRGFSKLLIEAAKLKNEAGVSNARSKY